MNARELLDVLDSSGYIEFSNAVLSREHYRQNLELLKSALRLQADAESNDGTTPETDAVDVALGVTDSRSGDAQNYRQLARRLERERNGLAAMVGEYESTDLCGPGGPCKALASSYAALAERAAELANERKRHDQTAKEGMDERDERAEAALAECRAKLEVDPRTKYDGIDCRDETIRMLEKELEESARLHGMGASREAALQARLAESERKCGRLKFHAEAMAKGMLDDGPANLWAAYDAYRAEFKEES